MYTKQQYNAWMSSDDTGTSSKSLFDALTDIPTGCNDIPYDMVDIGRCIRMLRLFPKLKENFPKVIEQDPKWMPFIDCWEKLERIYDDIYAFSEQTKEVKEKLKKEKLTPHDEGWNLMQKLVAISRYLDGWRMDKSDNSWTKKDGLIVNFKS